AGMAQHVRVDREGHLGGLPDALDEAVEANRALGNEDVGILRVLAAQLAESSHLVTPDWVHTGDSVLDPVNVKAALGQFDLLPLQVADLGGRQTVAIGDKDHGRVAMAVAAMLAGAVHEPLDLPLSEVASFNCQIYDSWGAILGSRFHRIKTSLFVVEWLS